jgi:predicted transcriptional regulator
MENKTSVLSLAFTSIPGQNWVSNTVLESFLRATKNYGDASKRHLMESTRLPFALFDDYFQYLLSNGFLQTKETPYENLYCLTQKGDEALNGLGNQKPVVADSNASV